MDSLPEFDGMLIAQKGKGWKDELDSFMLYCFASNDCSNKFHLADAVFNRIKYSVGIFIRNDFEFEEFASELQDVIYETWCGDGEAVMNYKPCDGVSFFDYVLNKNEIRRKWYNFKRIKFDRKKKSIISRKSDSSINSQEHSNPPQDEKNSHNKQIDNPDLDFDAMIPRDWKDEKKEKESKEEIIERLDKHVKDRINGKNFPDDDEIMTGVQLYWLYTDKDWINKDTVGLIALQTVTLETIADCHSEEEKAEKSSEARLKYWYKKSNDAVKNFLAQHARGTWDLETGVFIPDKRVPNSARSQNWIHIMRKVDAWSFYCPIHSAEALNDLLLIPYEKVTRRVNLYFNFIAEVILPDKKITKRSLTRVIPDDF